MHFIIDDEKGYYGESFNGWFMGQVVTDSLLARILAAEPDKDSGDAVPAGYRKRRDTVPVGSHECGSRQRCPGKDLLPVRYLWKPDPCGGRTGSAAAVRGV